MFSEGWRMSSILSGLVHYWNCIFLQIPSVLYDFVYIKSRIMINDVTLYIKTRTMTNDVTIYIKRRTMTNDVTGYIKRRTMTNDVTRTGHVPLLVTRVFTQAGTPSGIW